MTGRPRAADDFAEIARRREEIRIGRGSPEAYGTISYSEIWSDILDGFGSVLSLSRAIVNDGRDPDPRTGLPMETDDEFRTRIKQCLGENVA